MACCYKPAETGEEDYTMLLKVCIIMIQIVLTVNASGHIGRLDYTKDGISIITNFIELTAPANNDFRNKTIERAIRFLTWGLPDCNKVILNDIISLSKDNLALLENIIKNVNNKYVINYEEIFYNIYKRNYMSQDSDIIDLVMLMPFYYFHILLMDSFKINEHVLQNFISQLHKLRSITASDFYTHLLKLRSANTNCDSGKLIEIWIALKGSDVQSRDYSDITKAYCSSPFILPRRALKIVDHIKRDSKNELLFNKYIFHMYHMLHHMTYKQPGMISNVKTWNFNQVFEEMNSCLPDTTEQSLLICTKRKTSVVYYSLRTQISNKIFKRLKRSCHAGCIITDAWAEEFVMSRDLLYQYARYNDTSDEQLVEGVNDMIQQVRNLTYRLASTLIHLKEKFNTLEDCFNKVIYSGIKHGWSFKDFAQYFKTAISLNISMDNMSPFCTGLLGFQIQKITDYNKLFAIVNNFKLKVKTEKQFWLKKQEIDIF